MERKELSKTLFTKAFETQHNAFLWVALTQRLASIGARQVMSHFNYEICELRRRPVESHCIEFIIRPNFLTSNSR
ncbi:hypothetical protein MAL09_17635 [Leptospira noguchii]|nr:hypothetical protein MAL09_17635 [Leptospira noguchii]